MFQTLRNHEEFKVVGEATLAYLTGVKAGLNPEYGVVGTFSGTGLGDIALVVGPMLKDPKGVRDITEWYTSAVSRAGAGQTSSFQ